nr:RNA-directed DNA polymerase, eukaryota, reverse transcriptase zinc-binding domain protein [Tanacetum cinerariifolium]
IGVSSKVVAATAFLIGCFILTASFNYLSVKVGSNMSRITSWDDVISKVPIGVLNPLESIRLNFFYGVDGSDRKLAWIGWNMVLTSKKNGGALDTHKLIPRRSPWQDVILAIHSLQSKDINLMDFIQKKVDNEMCKSINVAEKMGHPSLSHSFRRMPRGGVEQKNYGLLCSKVADLVLPNISDRWCWSLEGSQEFSIKSSRILFDNTILPKVEVPTRWLRVVPIKILESRSLEPFDCETLSFGIRAMLIQMAQMARRVSDYRIRRIADRGNEEDGHDSRARGDRFYHNRRSADRGNKKVDRYPGNISKIKGLRRRVRNLEIQYEIRQIRKRIRELELQREMRKETESRYVVRDDVNEEEEHPSFDSYPRPFEPIYPDIFLEDEPRFDEEEVVNADYEEAPVFDDDPYEAETENIFAQQDIQAKLSTDEILDKPTVTPQLQKLDVNDDPVDALK